MIIKPKKTFSFTIPTDSRLWENINWGGWGNGYVAVMPDHPLYMMDYNKIHEQFNIDVHGGLTYSDFFKSFKNIKNVPNLPDNAWVIGFDTLHHGDSIDRWPDEASVLEEANKLKNQIDKIISI